MKKILLLLSACYSIISYAQPKDSTLLITLNQQIDDHVVKQNVAELQKLYAADFVFSHGSGKVEGKEGWLKSVAKGNFLVRRHDSVTVELHPQIGIVKGQLTVHKNNKEKTDRYHLKYIRVYAWRNDQWWMISHSTTGEWHDKD